MGELDLINRDPNNMNNYIQVCFDDVLAEPEGAHSADCVWTNSRKCFECGFSFYYKLCTYLCGICIALEWGCTFGAVAFSAIWCWTPYMRLMSIALAPTRKIFSIYLSTFVAPCMETAGLLFSRIHVVNSNGAPPKPLGALDNQQWTLWPSWTPPYSIRNQKIAKPNEFDKPDFILSFYQSWVLKQWQDIIIHIT